MRDDVDVIVIGAGIIGIASALYLQRDGMTVAIVDPEEPGEKDRTGRPAWHDPEESSTACSNPQGGIAPSRPRNAKSAMTRAL